MMIECINLSKRYEIGDAAFNAVLGADLNIKDGEFVAILGHSGSGKSTLLSMIGGLTRPSDGRVVIAGEDIWNSNDDARAAFRGRTLGFVFQFSSLIPTLTVLDNVLLPSLFAGGMTEEGQKHAIELLEAVGMGDKIDAFPSEISGGQQRRVAICRAFVNDPKIIIADEPTGDLDEATEAEVMRLFTTMRRQRRITILMVTHSRELTAVADRSLEMKEGRFL
jgi:putative ABC transport system ATP-binding protein/lipoprotein-releasing system ATP-binding protein